MSTTAPPADPISIVQSLRSEDIRRRLGELEAERRALVVLLRSISAKERATTRGKAVPRAS